MNSNIKEICPDHEFVEYVSNVLRYDVFMLLQKLLSNKKLLESEKNEIHKLLHLMFVHTRDCLSILSSIESTQRKNNISLHKIIENIIKEIAQTEDKVHVSFQSSIPDILIHENETITQTIVRKLLDMALQANDFEKIVFTTSVSSGYPTVSIHYKGKRLEPESLDNKNMLSEITFYTSFNNPLTVLKIFEKKQLGALSFSQKDDQYIIHFTFHTEAMLPGSNEIIKPQKQYNWNNKTILIVDDIEVNFIFLQTILAQTQVKTLYATNGAIAVEMCQQHPEIDLVLMDLKMPVMDGYEATRTIKRLRSDLPVIVQTAYSFEDEMKKSKEAGCDDYLTKPLRSDTVLSILAKYLNKN